MVWKVLIDARYWYKFTRLRVIRSIFARSVQFSSSSRYFLVLYNYEEPNSLTAPCISLKKRVYCHNNGRSVQLGVL